jgi:hypothetical protein
MSYTLSISENYYDVEDTIYQVILIRIIADSGIFVERADPLYVSVTDGSITIDSFANQLSGNKREILAIFTTDAFTSFTGLVDIEFGYSAPDHIFEAIDLSTEIEPLIDPILVPQADNAWLNSLS